MDPRCPARQKTDSLQVDEIAGGATQRNRELNRGLTGLRFDPDPAAEALDYTLANGKPDAASFVSRCSFWNTVNPLPVTWRDTEAVISDRNQPFFTIFHRAILRKTWMQVGVPVFLYLIALQVRI